MNAPAATRTAVWITLLLLATGGSSAQVQPPADAAPVVAATVNDQPVFVHEIDREVARVLRGRSVEPDAKAMLQAQALKQLIDRQLILLWLEQRQLAASEHDVEHAIAQLTKRLAEREIALADYLARRSMQTTELNKALLWQLSWRRFLDRYLTDDNLARYFDEHRRQFDGSELRVAHILLKIDHSDDPDELAEQLAEATRIRGEIVAGEMSFAEAAQQFSAAPTGAAGGVIGFISRHAPMPERFSQAAFQLEPGQISKPVVSAFGVHLIQCLEVKAGNKGWLEVRDRLEQSVTLHLFTWAAAKITDAHVKFTGTAPHFAPGTTRLSSN